MAEGRSFFDSWAYRASVTEYLQNNSIYLTNIHYYLIHAMTVKQLEKSDDAYKKGKGRE